MIPRLPIVLAVIAVAVPAVAEIRVETNRLAIVAPDRFEGLVERIRTELPVHLADVERALGGRLRRRLSVRVARDDDDFSRELERPAEQVAALARPAAGEIVLKASAFRLSPGETFPSIVRHELVHVVLYELVGGRRVPRWFDEGLAELVGGRYPVGASYELARGLAADAIVPLSELADRFPDDPDAFAFAYRESERFVSYLRSRIGMDGLRRVIATIRAGSSAADAIEEVSGVPLDEHEAIWRRRLEESRDEAIYALLAAWWWEILIVLVALGTMIGIVRYRVKRRRLLAEMDREEEASA